MGEKNKSQLRDIMKIKMNLLPMKLLKIAFFLFLFSLGSTAYTEEKKDRTPEPYGINEFATWQKDLRRFEILSFGALPFVSLFSFWGYDMIRSAKHPKDPGYYPWPLKQPDRYVALTEKEQKKVFFTAIGLSVGVALIDYTARVIIRAIRNKKLAKEQANQVGTIEAIPLEDYMIDENGMLKEEFAH